MEIKTTIITLLGIALPIVATIMGWIIARKTEEIKIMRTQLSDKKIAAYSSAVDMFYSILKDQKQNKRIDTNALLNKMLDAKKGIFLYGSDEVFKAFNDWLVHCNDSDAVNQMQYLLRFILLIRKDICGGKSRLSERDLLLNLTQSESETSKLEYNR